MAKFFNKSLLLAAALSFSGAAFGEGSMNGMASYTCVVRMTCAGQSMNTFLEVRIPSGANELESAIKSCRETLIDSQQNQMKVGTPASMSGSSCTQIVTGAMPTYH